MLSIWRVRLRMYEDGTVIPSASVEDAAQVLVRRLSELDQGEEIEVDADGERQPVCVFRKAETGEVLAVIDNVAAPDPVDFIEVGRVAHQLSAQHGTKAHRYAADTAARAQIAGDDAAHRFWRAVEAALRPR